MKAGRVVIFLLISLLGIAGMANAQEEQPPAEGPTGLAEYVQIDNEELQSGDVIILQDGKYERSTTPYDPRIVGVYTSSPAVAFNVTGSAATRALVSNGVVRLNVTTKNGDIEVGDFLTSSDEPGVAMKATELGYVLAVANESFSADESGTGQIEATIHIQRASFLDTDESTFSRARQQLSQAFTLSAIASAETPSTALKFLLAGLVLLISIAFGFWVFGRTATNGVIAIARNPLARRSIGFAVMFNVAMTVSIVASGVIVAYFIIIL